MEPEPDATRFCSLHWGPETQFSHGLVRLGREPSYEHLLDARNTMVSTRALETAYLHQFWTFLVLGCLGPFGAVFGVRKIPPLDVSVLGWLRSELAEPELAKLD